MRLSLHPGPGRSRNRLLPSSIGRRRHGWHPLPAAGTFFHVRVVAPRGIAVVPPASWLRCCRSAALLDVSGRFGLVCDGWVIRIVVGRWVVPGPRVAKSETEKGDALVVMMEVRVSETGARVDAGAAALVEAATAALV